MTFIHGLDELVPDTAAGKRASSRRHAEKRAAGEASRKITTPAAAAAASIPTTSWWVGADREAFARLQRERQEAMEGSKFGKGYSVELDRPEANPQ